MTITVINHPNFSFNINVIFDVSLCALYFCFILQLVDTALDQQTQYSELAMLFGPDHQQFSSHSSQTTISLL